MDLFKFLKGNRAMLVIGSQVNNVLYDTMEKFVPNVELIKPNVIIIFNINNTCRN